MPDLFTKADGLQVQKNDLARWRSVLNAIAYEALKEHCEHVNSLVVDGPQAGYKVFRGAAISTFINNIQEGA